MFHSLVTKPVVPTMPYLPQFDSACHATVLGLNIVFKADKKAINTQYRAMAKVFTKASNSKASTKLLTARDSLLKAIK